MNPYESILTWVLFIGLPLAFLALVAWLWRPGSATRYRRDARIPLAEDEPIRETRTEDDSKT
jgi:cbb3-type cytochrome oxidase subunit 3